MADNQQTAEKAPGKLLRRAALAAAVFAALVLAAIAYGYWPGTPLDKALANSGLDEKTLLANPDRVRIVVKKAEKELELIYGDTTIKTYPVSTGPGIPPGEPPPGKVGDKELMLRGLFHHPGDKVVEGDLRTPEGDYHLVYDFRPSKVNYKFALISYPDAEDRRASKNPGGAIGIHGLYPPYDHFGRYHAWVRHTRGCVALRNHEVDELARVAGAGTRVTVLP